MSTRTAPRSKIRIETPPVFALEVKQDRSRQLRDRTLAHAIKLVDSGAFDATSMAEIAQAVGCSVGALYSRFSNKEALFASVIDVAMKREVDAMSRRADKGAYSGLPLEQVVTRCVNDFIGFIQDNATMIRAMYQRGAGDTAYWKVVRVAVFDMVQVWIQAIAKAADRTEDKDYLRQAGMAFQFVSSTLVYSVLIESPVRPLGRRELEFWLREMLLHFITLKVPTEFKPASATPPTPKAQTAAPRPGTRGPARKAG